MKVVELLSIGRELLKRMSEGGIRVDDYKYADMYHEYTEMRSRGEKYWYVVPTLPTSTK